MGDCNRQSGGSGGSALSVLAGAVIGAAGLAWWLLSEAERRRLESRPRRTVADSNRSPFSRSVTLSRPSVEPGGSAEGERDLHDRVHELNQAIDDVRRQLETMNTQA